MVLIAFSAQEERPTLSEPEESRCPPGPTGRGLWGPPLHEGNEIRGCETRTASAAAGRWREHALLSLCRDRSRRAEAWLLSEGAQHGPTCAAFGN